MSNSRESRMRKIRNERSKKALEHIKKLRSDARSGKSKNFSKGKKFEDIKNRNRYPRLFVDGNLAYVGRSGSVGAKINKETIRRWVNGGGEDSVLRILRRILSYQKKHKNYDQIKDAEKWIDKLERE